MRPIDSCTSSADGSLSARISTRLPPPTPGPTCSQRRRFAFGEDLNLGQFEATACDRKQRRRFAVGEDLNAWMRYVRNGPGGRHRRWFAVGEDLNTRIATSG